MTPVSRLWLAPTMPNRLIVAYAIIIVVTMLGAFLAWRAVMARRPAARRTSERSQQIDTGKGALGDFVDNGQAGG